MKKIDIKSLIALLAAVMLLFTTVGAAAAYFSAKDEAVGAATVNLQKETKIDEGPDNRQKQIDITNTGTAAIIVRVTFFGPDMLAVTGNSDWVQGADGWYYYRYVLEPGDNTGEPKLIAQLNDLTPQQIAEMGTSLQVSVVQEAEFAIFSGTDVIVPANWEIPSGFKFEEKNKQ